MRQTPADLSSKIHVAVLILAVCCLVSTARILRDAPVPTHLRADDIAGRSDQRFGALRAALPARGVVGYIGDPGNPPAADYYLSQYALAPLVVDHSTNHPLVVGNFVGSPLRALPGNLRLLQDFGNGVMLFANKDAQ